MPADNGILGTIDFGSLSVFMWQRHPVGEGLSGCLPVTSQAFSLAAVPMPDLAC